MTSLLDLVRQVVPQGILDPWAERLLGAIDPVPVPELPVGDAVEVGQGAIEDLLEALASIVPVPMDPAAAAAALGPLGDVPVKAARVGQTGWRLSVELPRLEVEIPELDAGKVEGAVADARVVKDDNAGPVRLLVEAHGAGAVVLEVKAPNGTDPAVSLASATIRLEPAIVALPFGFGLTVGPITISADGAALPEAGFYLPPIPRLPVGKVEAPITIGSLTSAVKGVAIDLASDVELDNGLVADLRVIVQRPSARTLLDLVPTKVSFKIPLEGGSFEVGGHSVDPQPTGAGAGGLSVAGEIGVSESSASLYAELTGSGGDDGLAALGGPTLSLAAALAPCLVPADARNAAATAIISLVAALEPELGGDGDVTIHSLCFDARWAAGEPLPPTVRVRLDYEARMGVDATFGGMRVKTTKPMRVRYRDVGVDLAVPPLLSWDQAPMSLVSPGDWQVLGIPDDLLRVGDVRTGKGSLVIDIDLRTAVQLGVVTIDSTTVRVRIADETTVSPAGFGIGVDIPGVLKGRGQLMFPPDGGFGAALDVTLPTIGAFGRAVVAIGDPLVVVAFEARLFAPIPFANSGLGLFGLSGALASGAARKLPAGETDPILREVRWTPFDPGAWEAGSQVYVGVGAEIGTVPDLGFAFASKAGILVGLPDPMLRIALEAQLLRGATGQLKGVLLVDGNGVKAGLLGEYTIPVLLKAEVPAGAEFPIAHPGAWAARLGGDGDDGRMGPITVHILPDLLGLDAWAFLMAFGNAATTAGATMAPPGLPLDGLSLAFGAGVDVHWAAGPFSFDAHGVIMAALTHKPPRPDGEHPWILAGLAEIRGSVDLGPVSIGASARLDVLVQDDPPLLYGHAKACASVDLWLFEIEGCVEFDIGDPPALDVPDPQSPFKAVHLTDRCGLVVETIDAGETPTVWADAVPALTFTHYVAAAPAIAGLRQPIGDWVPDGGGWVGTADLEYRFELSAVHVVERLPDGTEIEVGGDWDSSWQFPISSDIWGSSDVPAEARALALCILDPQHRLQPATVLGPAAGDPIGVLGRLCLPLKPPAPTWFHGELARIDGFNGPVSVPPTLEPRRSIDLGPLAVELLGPHDSPVPLDDDVDAVALDMGAVFVPAWVDEDPEPLVLDVAFGGRLWLPMLRPLRVEDDELHGTVVLGATDVLIDGRLLLAVQSRDPAPAQVTGEDGSEWDYRGLIATWGSLAVHEFTSGTPTAQVRVRPFGNRPLALVGLGAVGGQARSQYDATEGGRRATQQALAHAAGDAGTPRKMLVPGATYSISLQIGWQGRGTNRTARPGSFSAGPFSFKVASKGARPRPPGDAGRPAPPTDLAIGQLATFKALATSSLAATRRYDQTVLDSADLGRYVGGFVPPDGTSAHFLDDPVQATFVVDHLPDLAAAYSERLSVVASRLQGPPDDGPPDVATALGVSAAVAVARPEPAAPVISAHDVSHLTALDAARSGFVDLAPTDDPGCRIRRPGAVVQPLGRLVRSSTYRLGVHVDAAPPGEPPEQAGSHSPVAATTFRTSRFANPTELLAALGLTVAGGALAAIPLPADATAAVTGLLTDGDHVGTAFDDALRTIGLDGYRPPEEPMASALWGRSDSGEYHLVGALVECPEPLWRPGRLDPARIRLAGVEVGVRYWDARRTRLLALVPQPGAPTGDLEVTMKDTPPGSAAVERTVHATAPAYAALAGVLP